MEPQRASIEGDFWIQGICNPEFSLTVIFRLFLSSAVCVRKTWFCDGSEWETRFCLRSNKPLTEKFSFCKPFPHLFTQIKSSIRKVSPSKSTVLPYDCIDWSETRTRTAATFTCYERRSQTRAAASAALIPHGHRLRRPSVRLGEDCLRKDPLRRQQSSREEGRGGRA